MMCFLLIIFFIQMEHRKSIWHQETELGSFPLSLTHLHIYCGLLTSLPISLGQLRRLRSLYLEECFTLPRLPESLGLLAALQTLRITQCFMLTCLPESLGQLRRLTSLRIEICNQLSSLPESLGRE